MALSKVLICILLVCLTQSFESTQLSSLNSLVAEVKKLGQDLVLEAGCVKFWFLEICYDKPFAGNLLERLIREEPFLSNPKIILSESGEVNFRESQHCQPTLVFLVLGDDLQISSPAMLNLARFKVQTRFVVIFLHHSQQQLFNMLSFFKSIRLFNTLYIAIQPDTGSYTMFNYMIWQDFTSIIDRYESLRQTFPEQSDLAGRDIVACTHLGGIFSDFDPVTGEPKGLDVISVSLVISKMNGNLKIGFLNCLSSDTDAECVHRKLSQKHCMFNFARWMLQNAEVGFPLMPMKTLVVLAPRAGLMNTWDLLRAPFTFSLWVTLISTMLICIFGMRACFRRSGIEMVLFVVCGISGSYLNRKKTVEKLISVSMSLLIFLIMSSYEAKMVSFLANWPYLPDVKSIEELQPAGIAVATESHFTPSFILTDPRLRDLFVKLTPSKDSSFVVKPNTAMLMGYETAQVGLYCASNFDFKKNRARFVMIEERLDVQLTFFYFGLRNPLMARFGQIYQKIFEAGIIQHFKNMIPLHYSGPNDQNQPEAAYIKHKELIQLQCLFYTLWLGATIVFLLELISCRVKLYLRKSRKISPTRPRALSYPLEKRVNETTSTRNSV